MRGERASNRRMEVEGHAVVVNDQLPGAARIRRVQIDVDRAHSLVERGLRVTRSPARLDQLPLRPGNHVVSFAFEVVVPGSR
jgi:hypothetical protein